MVIISLGDRATAEDAQSFRRVTTDHLAGSTPQITLDVNEYSAREIAGLENAFRV